ncbi:FAD-dependent oxidoreductase [Enterococcus sp. LJL90]
MEVKFSDLPIELQKIAIFPDDSRYDEVRSNDYRIGHPQLVLLAATEADVMAAVQFVAKINRNVSQNIPFSVRSGGHGLTTTSVNDDGIVLDLSNLNHVHIMDETKGLVKIEAGAICGEVAQTLNPHHLVISSGDHGDTGVGGLAVSGGLGIVLRSFGLTIDKVIGATIVTADGKKRWLDQENHADLFWAIRGGGGQFGVVVDFLFQADVIDNRQSDFDVPIIVQKINYSIQDLKDFIPAWQQWVADSSRKLTSIILFNRGADNTVSGQVKNFWYGADSPTAQTVFKKTKDLASVAEESLQVMEYADFVKPEHVPLAGKNTAYGKNILIKELSSETIDLITQLLDYPFVYGVELRALGGAVNDVSSDFNAWSNRNAELLITFWFNHEFADEALPLFAPFEKIAEGVYGAYSRDISAAETKRVWSEETANRLRMVKAKYDPDNMFTENRMA